MKTVFFDVDTQIDFLYPAGALYVPGAEAVVGRIAALNAFAAGKRIPVVSTMDAHTEDDPEFKQWPHHCVVDTAGQKKPAGTLLEKRVIVASRPCNPQLDDVQQVVIEKQTLDCFSNPNLPGILERLGAERCIVYGVVTEICVQLAAFGLLKTGRRVELVTDAVRSLSEEAAARTLAQFQASSGKLTTISAVIG